MTPLPTWDQFMTPVLTYLTGGQTVKLRALIEGVAAQQQLTDEQRAEVLDSGQARYVNRIGWAASYLVKAGALERPARGQYVITEAGRRLLAAHPNGLTEKDLRGPPGYQRVASQRASRPESPAIVHEESSLDPEEQIDSGVARIHADVADEILSRILQQEPVFFEQAVLDLLLAMGYGGAEGRATRTQLSHDGGIDGIIDQDALGLSRIYVQAKRYGSDNAVGREAIQAFVGALAGKQANQGVFITTSRFARTAIEYAQSITTRVILIGGDQLTRLMIRYGVGVQVKKTVTIVEVDEDFFS